MDILLLYTQHYDVTTMMLPRFNNVHVQSRGVCICLFDET